MKRSHAKLVSLAVFAAALAFGGCDGGLPSQEKTILLAPEAIMSERPALALRGVTAWTAESRSELSAHYLLVRAESVYATVPPGISVRLALINGRAELRAGAARVRGTPAYALAPAGASWSVARLGPEPVLLVLLVSPGRIPLPELLGASNRNGR